VIEYYRTNNLIPTLVLDRYENNCKQAENKFRQLVNGVTEEITFELEEIPKIFNNNYLWILISKAQKVTGKLILMQNEIDDQSITIRFFKGHE